MVKQQRSWYAEQCTTSTAQGKNINRNCNFSKDFEPAHYYTPWDSVYHKFYYLPNKKFKKAVFDSKIQKLTFIKIDTNSKAEHRKLFFSSIVKGYYAKLTITDTARNCTSDTDSIYLSLVPPSAKGLTITQVESLITTFWKSPRNSKLTHVKHAGRDVAYYFSMQGLPTKKSCSWFAVDLNSRTDDNAKDLNIFNEGKVDHNYYQNLLYTNTYQKVGQFPNLFYHEEGLFKNNEPNEIKRTVN